MVMRLQALKYLKTARLKDEQRMRLSGIHSSYVYATLDQLDGVQLSAHTEWLEKAKQLHAQERKKAKPSPP